MVQTGAAGGASEQDLYLRLQGLQHEVEKSASLVRRLGFMSILLVIALVSLLISLHLYHVMQYARVESVEAFALDGRPESAEIQYRPKSPGKIEFVRESEGLVQTLTEYANAPDGGGEKAGGRFTWSGKPGETSTIRVTYRDGLFLVSKDLPLTSRRQGS